MLQHWHVTGSHTPNPGNPCIKNSNKLQAVLRPHVPQTHCCTGWVCRSLQSTVTVLPKQGSMALAMHSAAVVTAPATCSSLLPTATESWAT
jgi:hypothetical protein